MRLVGVCLIVGVGIKKRRKNLYDRNKTSIFVADYSALGSTKCFLSV